MRATVVRLSSIAVALFLAAGCSEPLPPEESYYDRQIDPIVRFGCAMQTTGCHVADDRGTAAGNLDISSYDALARRQDALDRYGPYPLPLLLMKISDPLEIAVETLDPPDPTRPDDRVVRVTTDVRHAAGAGVALDSSGFLRLAQWLADGHARDGAPLRELGANEGECVRGVGSWPGFDPDAPPSDATSYDRFVSDVQPVLRARCAGSACHGAKAADLYLACGDDERELRWNWFISVAHLSQPIDRSELLRRPVRGGASHGGGAIFESESDPELRAIREWATDTAARGLAPSDEITDGFRFFANRVQPMLVKKGCLFMACHSPLSFHDLKLRGGSQGAFSRVATRRNYDAALRHLAPESPDPAASRIVAKNLLPAGQLDGAVGILHRGGPLFEDFGAPGGVPNLASPEDCASYDADGGSLDDVPAYCVLARWHAIEREDAIARGDVIASDDAMTAIVYVARPPGTGGVTDFDPYRPGADLRIVDARLDASHAIEILGAPRSLLAGCGLPAATTDVRRPWVSWDGARIAFAARTSAAEPLRLYEMAADGSGCAPIAGIAPPVSEENGILTHDFDPAYTHDGRLVFASTRGNLDRTLHDYAGPTRTPASMAPNANLYMMEPAGLRQLTFLLNQEVAPAFKANGRVIFVAEKREPGFHQLALRRQNLDGGDYHPLFAQRDSVGFPSATSVIQMPNRELVFVAGPLGTTDGAGTIAVVSRSLGPDQADRDPTDRSYVHSMRMPAPGAYGGLQGAFRSPAALPSRRVLVSCDLDATDLFGAPFDFDLCELDPATGVARVVVAEAGAAEVDAVAVYQRPVRTLLESTADVENNAEVEPGRRDAVTRLADVPMIATLFFANTREGRPIDARIGGFDILEVLPPPIGSTTFDDVRGSVVADEYGEMFLSRRMIGHVPLFEDGSAAMRLPGGTPIVFRFTGRDGEVLIHADDAPYEGPMIQREQFQYYPGERARQSIPRRFFNTACAGCHGSITGRELDVVIDADIVTGASTHAARDSDPTDIDVPPGDRLPVPN